MGEILTYEQVNKIWRKKVFQLLIEMKLYELIMKDNLA